MLLFSAPPHLFIFGDGYVGTLLATRMCQLGYKVSTSNLTKSPPSASIQTYLSTEHSSIKAALGTSTHVISTVPPSQPSLDPILDTYADVLHASHSLICLAYLSSTSVYGNHHGRWIDEHAPSINAGVKARQRLKAEQAWSQLAGGRQSPTSLYLFRLAGIYGPGRSAVHTLRTSKRGAWRNSTSSMFVSRIHVEDGVQAMMNGLIKDPLEGRIGIFNLADDLPATRQEVFGFAERILHLESDAEGRQGRDVSGRDWQRASKKVCNEKMKRMLHGVLKYPTYRHGLPFLL